MSSWWQSCHQVRGISLGDRMFKSSTIHIGPSSNGTCGYTWGSTLNLQYYAPSMHGLYKAYGETFEKQTTRELSHKYLHFPFEPRYGFPWISPNMMSFHLFDDRSWHIRQRWPIESPAHQAKKRSNGESSCVFWDVRIGIVRELG